MATHSMSERVLRRIFTPHTTFEELFFLLTEHPQANDVYAVVRVGQAGYSVLTLADLQAVQADADEALLVQLPHMPLGRIIPLQLQYSAFPPIPEDDLQAWEHWERDEYNRLLSLYPETRQCLVVVDAAGAVVGVLPIARRSDRGMHYGTDPSPGVLGHPKGPAPAATPQPHLNTRFDGLADDEPLTVNQRTPLIVSVGAPTASNRAQSSRPFSFSFADESSPVEFTVHVNADPESWTIKPIEQTMIVAPPGQTTQEAEFLVTARQPGRDKLLITVERADTQATVQTIWLPVQAAAAGDQSVSLGSAERTVMSLPLDTFTVRPKVELTFTSKDDAFEVFVRADMPSGTIRDSYRVPVSPHEVQNATVRLRDELHKIVFHRHTANGQISYPFAALDTFTVEETLANQTMLALADAGEQTWNMLFHGPRAPEGLRKLAEDIRDLPHGSTIQVIVDSQQFIVPWMLLYDKPGRLNAETIDKAGFWGYRYKLDVLPPGRYPDPQITSDPLGIQVFFNDEAELRQFTEQQEQYLGSTLATANVTTDWGRDAVEERLMEPIEAALVYFYCHGEQTSGAVQRGSLASESGLFFSGKQYTRVVDLRRLPVAPFTNQPLVFLNACKGATQDAFYYDGFMPLFIEEMGARGFIGTEVMAPQLLAHDFALKFLDAFARGQSVGDILWTLRRHYMDEHHNILAFNYSLYCLSDVRLAEPMLSDGA